MTYKELVKMVEDGRKPFVEFTKGIERYEGYFDVGMRAKIVNGFKAGDNGETVRLDFNFKQFTAYNDSVEKHNYWDKNGNAILSAKEADMYPKDCKETYWFDVDEEICEYFAFFEYKNDIYEKYLVGRTEGQSYTVWMEEVIQSFYDKARKK